MNEKENWKKQLDDFWNNFQESVQKDNGIRAVLKRNAGTRLYEADSRAIAAFYRIYHGKVAEDRYFFAICSACLWKPEEWKNAVPLVEGAKKYMSPEQRETFSKRMQVLLDLPWDEDGYFTGKLLRLLKFCQSKGIVVDGKRLLDDLIHWDQDNRWVQRKWAKEFYRSDINKDDGGKENVD